MPFHNKEASRYKVCIQNVAIVGFLGFASQVVPYVNYSIVCSMAVVYSLLGLHSYCLMIFIFGWVLLGIQAIEK